MVSSFFFVVIFSKQNVIKHQPSSSSQYNWMITLNDPKLFTRSKSRRKRAQHEREGSKNATKVVYVRRSDPRGPFSERERASCVCVFSSFFDHIQNRCRFSPTKSTARGSNSRHDDSKKKETTTTPPKRNAPPVIDDVLHKSRRAGGGVGEHLFNSRSGVSKKGTWCSDDVFDAFY